MNTKLGVLELFQLLVLLVSTGIISTTEDNREEHFGSIDVFWAVHSIIIAAVTTTLIAYMADVTSNLPAFVRARMTKIALCLVAYLALIGSSAWMISKHYNHGAVVMAGLFGLFAGLLFVIEDMFYIVSFSRHTTLSEGDAYQYMVDEAA